MTEQELAAANEEKVKKISAMVMTEINKAKDSDAPLNDAKVNRMIADQMLTLDMVNLSRRAVEFETEQKMSSEQLEEYFKDENALDPKQRRTNQEIKMLQGEKHLSRKHDDSLAARIEDFKDINDEAYLVSTMLFLAEKKDNKAADFMDIYRGTDSYKYLHRTLDNDVDLRKALAVATTGSGAEWIPTGFSSQVA